MLNFSSDYTQGTHPEVLKRLVETNYEYQPGYTEDAYCKSAEEKIKEACGCPDGKVYFLVGGTQTNAVICGTVPKAYEGIIAAKTGHISCHEAGAIEYTGHKVMEVPGYEGKMKATDVRALCETFYGDDFHEHMVFPGMVYISYPTEYGTLYSKAELQELYATCQEFGMKLFVDGARLGYGLAAPTADITLQDLAHLCDVFYIGGTKVGALCGEAVVFPNGGEPAHFLNLVKKHGAMLEKGRLLGLQFETLFSNDLYFRNGKNGIEKAQRLKEMFRQKGYQFYIDSPTNQQFVILEDGQMEELKKHVSFGFWEKADETHTVVRFATSWATMDKELDELETLI